MIIKSIATDSTEELQAFIGAALLLGLRVEIYPEKGEFKLNVHWEVKDNGQELEE